MFDFTQVSNFLSELFGDNVRFQECLILHRSQTGKRRIFFARQVWRCLILHRSQTSQLTSLQQMSFCWYVVLHRAQMTGLNGDNKVNDFTQVSNSASARSGAGFRGVRFYISLKPLKFFSLQFRSRYSHRFQAADSNPSSFWKGLEISDLHRSQTSKIAA